jgi:hypothetical protein
MTVDAISPATVRDALHALRYGQSLHRSPLVDLDLVTMHMRAEGLADTPESRAWALGQAIEAIVWLQLSKQRGTELGGPGTDVAPDTEFRLLGEDLSSGSKERAAWGLLYPRSTAVGMQRGLVEGETPI